MTMHALNIATRVPSDSVMRPPPSYTRGGRVYGEAAPGVDTTRGAIVVAPVDNTGGDAPPVTDNITILTLRRQLQAAEATIIAMQHAADARNARIRHLESMFALDGDREALDVLAAVAAVLGIKTENLIVRCRARWLSWARQMACALLVEVRPEMPLTRIGVHIGGCDHTSVVYSVCRMHDRVRAGTAHPAWPDLRGHFGLPAALPALVRGRVWTCKRRKKNAA